MDRRSFLTSLIAASAAYAIPIPLSSSRAVSAPSLPFCTFPLSPLSPPAGNPFCLNLTGDPFYIDLDENSGCNPSSLLHIRKECSGPLISFPSSSDNLEFIYSTEDSLNIECDGNVGLDCKYPDTVLHITTGKS